MKYSVSVVKRITLLIMTMALAVAMVACTGATSVKGETGATGPQGEAGPQGPAGESSNEPPMAKADKPLKNLYLALAGTGAMPMKTGINLDDHFTDEENASLTYKADPSEKGVATAKVEGNMLTVTGKKAGSTKIEVKAYDGVNSDPAMASFDVQVVASNAAPTVSPSTDPLGARESDRASAIDKLENRLYAVDGERKVEVAGLMLSPGAVSEQDINDRIVPSIVVGGAGGEDDIVEVDLDYDAKKNVWYILLSPIKPGLQQVEITVKDMFGMSATPKLVFYAYVNTPPELATDLPDKTLVAGGSDGVYLVKEYFDIAEKAPQKTDRTADDTDNPTPLPRPGGDGASATCSYSVSRTVTTGDVPGIASVDDTGTPSTGVASVTIDPDTAEEGSFYLTITCMDRDATKSDTAKITVRK